ncbi:MAG: hypothetical protein JW925_13185 [Syntrophaceae bacterium]|nr:hypothetical protein [Syntrophaceae bacterium]
MTDAKKDIYYSFEGAGGPGTPPPPNPQSNPDRARFRLMVLGFVLVLPAIALSYLVYQGMEYLKLMVAGIVAGITIAVADWIYEVYAYVRGYWFVYGGHTRLGKVNLYHVPLEMTIGFVPLGLALIALSYLPLLPRHFGIMLWPFSYPSLDNILVLPVTLIITAFIGGYVDFASKKYGLFMNGHNWDYFVHCMSIWLPLSTMAVVISRIIINAKDCTLLYLSTIGIILFLCVASIALFKILYIRKHFDSEGNIIRI